MMQKVISLSVSYILPLTSLSDDQFCKIIFNILFINLVYIIKKNIKLEVLNYNILLATLASNGSCTHTAKSRAAPLEYCCLAAVMSVTPLEEMRETEWEECS